MAGKAVGKSIPRVDAYEKVTGRTQYTDDLCPKDAYVARILTATVANGRVLSMDTSEAEAIPGVVKVVTCFDVPKTKFPTAGHPWSTDPAHQDVADRLLLTDRPRFYGDEIAAVIAEDEVAAAQGLRAIKVEYEEYPHVLDVLEAMKEDAPLIHEEFPGNILKHTEIHNGNYAEAIKEPGLVKVEGWYDTPTVQHCHIENFVCFAYQDKGRVVVVSSTQIPHIVRRVVGQALDLPWGKVRVVKPYIGGGFGNKQDVLYEPLCAFLSLQVAGHPVKIDVPREDTFVSNRVRHAIRQHIISWVRPDGTFAARKLEIFSNQGAYASHGHSICAKGAGAFPQMYPCDNVEVDAYTVFTNRPVAGAMRGYGIPQAMFAVESHNEDICRQMDFDPVEFRRKNLMPKGYVDNFSKNQQYYDTYNQCLDRAIEIMDYDRKRKEYENQTGPIRRGIGVAPFWYNTAVWPISLETSSCRMVMNQDGSVQVQLGETEIGQGADTAYSQMAAEVIGIPVEMVHVESCQDTDITPYGTGAYASRQTYVGGFSIAQTAELLKKKILAYAEEWLNKNAAAGTEENHAASAEKTTAADGATEKAYRAEDLDILDAQIVRVRYAEGEGVAEKTNAATTAAAAAKTNAAPTANADRKIESTEILMSLSDLCTEALYCMTHSEHFTAESTYTIQSNAYSFGCCIAEVEVDIPACRVRVDKLVNVHDCGNLINPALAEAQVHGGQSMGIGYALSETELFDGKTGRVLNNNLLDYKLSTAMDHPELIAAFVENPEPTSPFGTKALGEPPTCPVAPAIRNAVLQATGVGINEAPLRPQVLFEHFRDADLL